MSYCRATVTEILKFKKYVYILQIKNSLQFEMCSQDGQLV